MITGFVFLPLRSWCVVSWRLHRGAIDFGYDRIADH